MKLRNQDDEGNQKDEMLLRQVRYRSFAKIILMTLNICLSPFYFGYSIQYLGTFQFETIQKVFHITISTETAKGLANGCVPIGGGIGALTSFIILKNFSRKNSLLLVNIVAIVFGLLLFIENQATFFISRVMQGACVGFYSAIAPLIIKQFAPNEISGTLGALNQLFVAFGVFFACLLQYIFKKTIGVEQDYWRIMFGFTLITVTLQTILLLVVYRFQTPKYLLQKDREQQCRQVLKWIYFDEYVQEVMNQKKADLGLVPSQEFNKQSVVSNGSTILEGKSKRNKLRLIVALHLAILQQFVGINAVVIYGTQIAKQVLPDLGNLIPVILNLQQTLTSLLTSYLLTRLGRKQILQAGTGVSVLSLLMIGIGFFVHDSSGSLSNVLIIGGLVIFMANFGLSLGPIVWLYIPEILEPDLIAFSTGANWATATLITILFPIIKDAVGSSAYLFLFYALYSVFGFFFSQKFVIQTKGRSQKQIYQQYEQMAA